MPVDTDILKISKIENGDDFRPEQIREFMNNRKRIPTASRANEMANDDNGDIEDEYYDDDDDNDNDNLELNGEIAKSKNAKRPSVPKVSTKNDMFEKYFEKSKEEKKWDSVGKGKSAKKDEHKIKDKLKGEEQKDEKGIVGKEILKKQEIVKSSVYTGI